MSALDTMKSALLDAKTEAASLRSRVRQLEEKLIEVADAGEKETEALRATNTTLRECNESLIALILVRGTHTEICRSQGGEAKRRRFWKAGDEDTCSCALRAALATAPVVPDGR